MLEAWWAERHSLRGGSIVQGLNHPDSVSGAWRPASQRSHSESSGDGYVGDRKSQLETMGSCGGGEGLWTKRHVPSLASALSHLPPGVKDFALTLRVLSAGPAPDFQLTA